LKNKILRFLQLDLACLGIAWVVFAVIYILRIQEIAIINWMIMIMMLANSILFILFIYLTNKKNSFVFTGLTIFLLINTILTFTDQMGVYDWIILVANLAALSLAVILTIRMLKAQRRANKSF
jgi:hypothetical protein